MVNPEPYALGLLKGLPLGFRFPVRGIEAIGLEFRAGVPV